MAARRTARIITRPIQTITDITRIPIVSGLRLDILTVVVAGIATTAAVIVVDTWHVEDAVTVNK